MIAAPNHTVVCAQDSQHKQMVKNIVRTMLIVDVSRKSN